MFNQSAFILLSILISRNTVGSIKKSSNNIENQDNLIIWPLNPLNWRCNSSNATLTGTESSSVFASFETNFTIPIPYFDHETDQWDNIDELRISVMLVQHKNNSSIGSNALIYENGLISSNSLPTLVLNRSFCAHIFIKNKVEKGSSNFEIISMLISFLKKVFPTLIGNVDLDSSQFSTIEEPELLQMLLSSELPLNKSSKNHFISTIIPFKEDILPFPSIFESYTESKYIESTFSKQIIEKNLKWVIRADQHDSFKTRFMMTNFQYSSEHSVIDVSVKETASTKAPSRIITMNHDAIMPHQALYLTQNSNDHFLQDILTNVKIRKFPLSYNAPAKLSASIKTSGKGFHYKMSVNMVYPNDGVSELSSCEFVLIQQVPTTIYIDLDEIKQLERLKKLTLLNPSSIYYNIDVEKPSYMSMQHTVAMRFTLSLTNISSTNGKSLMTYPFHLRYQNPNDDKSNDLKLVALPPPLIVYKCQDDVYTWNKQQDFFILSVPVGNTQNVVMIRSMTGFLTLVGALLIIIAAYLSDKQKEKKKID